MGSPLRLMRVSLVIVRNWNISKSKMKNRAKKVAVRTV